MLLNGFRRDGCSRCIPSVQEVQFQMNSNESLDPADSFGKSRPSTCATMFHVEHLPMSAANATNAKHK
jgi:hypothetical protein